VCGSIWQSGLLARLASHFFKRSTVFPTLIPSLKIGFSAARRQEHFGTLGQSAMSPLHPAREVTEKSLLSVDFENAFGIDLEDFVTPT